MSNSVLIISYGFVKHISIAGKNVTNLYLANLETAAMKKRI